MKTKLTAKDQKMLQSALWHISNSVTNGKSQTAECELTQWLKEKFNALPAEQPSEELEYLATSLEETIGTSPHSRETIISYLQQAAQWQKEQMMKGFCFETKVYQDCDGDDIESPFQTWLSLEQNEITALPNLGLSDGDKVKVIIVKEDKQ